MKVITMLALCFCFASCSTVKSIEDYLKTYEATVKAYCETKYPCYDSVRRVEIIEIPADVSGYEAIQDSLLHELTDIKDRTLTADFEAAKRELRLLDWLRMERARVKEVHDTILLPVRDTVFISDTFFIGSREIERRLTGMVIRKNERIKALVAENNSLKKNFLLIVFCIIIFLILWEVLKKYLNRR